MENNKNLCKFIKKIIAVSYASSLVDLKINKNLETILLYPTNDLFLTQQQYKTLWQFLNIVGESKCYLTQFDNVESGIDSETNTFLCIHNNLSYNEYLDFNLFSLSMLLSEKGRWAIFIEETLEDGIGLFIADKKYMDIFKNCYLDYCRDLTHYQEDIKKFHNFTNDEYCIKLMKLLSM